MKNSTAWLALALPLAACGGDGAPPPAAATIDTLGGVERLTYPAEPVRDLAWSVDTVGVLGDAFASDEYQFNDVSEGGVSADDSGNLYILDRQGGRVLKYGPDGNHRGTFGRKGEGPGELNQPISMAVGDGDTIWVSDFSNSRITGLPQGGGDARTIPLPDNVGIPGQRLAALNDGFITMFRPLFNFRRGSSGWSMSRGGEAADSGPPQLPVLRLSRSLDPVDTLWTTPEPPMDMVQLEAGDRLMVTLQSREFYPEFQWAPFSDGGVVIVDSAAYVIHILAADGSRVRTIERGPAPRATTEADRELARQRLRNESESGVRIGGGGPDEDMQERILQQRLEKMTFADLIPRVVTLQVDPADRIWVGVSEDTPDEVDRIDVYDRSGLLLGEVRDFPVPTVFLGADRIGVLRRDELDVQQVVILDIRRPEQEVAAAR
jgi:hypothetical protein